MKKVKVNYGSDNIIIKPLNLKLNSQFPKKLAKIAKDTNSDSKGCGLCKIVLGDG